MTNEIKDIESMDDLVNETMNYSYMIITKQLTLDELFELDGDFGVIFDPDDENVNYNKVIKTLLNHFIYLEEYEKCQDLVDAKEKYYS